VEILQTLGTGQGHLKAGFLGFPKSGKTYTAALLAIGTRKLMKLEGPIAIFDTEGGSEYIYDLIKRETGKDLIGVRSRSFHDLLAAGKECVDKGVSVMLVDSISHVWKEVCEAFLKSVNDKRKKRNLPPRPNLEFQDWNPLKRIWSEWPDFYLTSPLHIIICGRAGFEYDYSENEETGKKELIKTGTKMRVESEFGFEPSLLVEMERVRTGKTLKHKAIVIGDRFGVIDGKERDNPTFDFFKPHVERLTPGAHAVVDTSVKSELDVDEEGNPEWRREKRERTILCEEIQGLLLKYYPSQASADKKKKADIIEMFFNTRSWTKVENLDSETLRSGLEGIREKLEGEFSLAPEEEKEAVV